MPSREDLLEARPPQRAHTACAKCARSRPSEANAGSPNSPVRLDRLPACPDLLDSEAGNDYYVCSLECAMALIGDSLLQDD